MHRRNARKDKARRFHRFSHSLCLSLSLLPLSSPAQIFPCYHNLNLRNFFVLSTDPGAVSYGCREGQVSALHTRPRAVANSEVFLSELRKATGVWIGGGRQWQWGLVDSYREAHVVGHTHTYTCTYLYTYNVCVCIYARMPFLHV
jgi:hypothetical protein